jgi:protein-disulfide isomerase
MRIYIAGFSRFAGRMIRHLLAGSMAASLGVAATAQQTMQQRQPGDDIAILKNDVQQLKAQQQLILDRLDELKKLLNSRAGNAQPPLKVPDTMGVDGELFRGEATAPVAIIEYADIECPFCRHFERDVYPRVFDDYIKTGKARLYYRDMPLPFHEHAVPAARAAHCAGEQGKFWEMHDSLFTDKIPIQGPNGRSSGLGASDIDERAAKLGLDTAKLSACIASTRFADVIKHSSEEAAKMNIEGTPTFVIGTIDPKGHIVTVKKTIIGAQPFGAFKSAIDPLLAAAPEQHVSKPLPSAAPVGATVQAATVQAAVKH